MLSTWTQPHTSEMHNVSLHCARTILPGAPNSRPSGISHTLVSCSTVGLTAGEPTLKGAHSRGTNSPARSHSRGPMLQGPHSRGTNSQGASQQVTWHQSHPRSCHMSQHATWQQASSKVMSHVTACHQHVTWHVLDVTFSFLHLASASSKVI
jgi:hypothetical protein